MKQSGIYLSDQFNAMKDRALRAEAERDASRGVIARLKEGQKNLNANLQGAKAELAASEQELEIRTKSHNTAMTVVERLREALLGLLHHMPLRGEPVTAKELAIKRARDVLVGGSEGETCSPKYDRDKEDIKSLQELLDFRTDERDSYKTALCCIEILAINSECKHEDLTRAYRYAVDALQEKPISFHRRR